MALRVVVPTFCHLRLQFLFGRLRRAVPRDNLHQNMVPYGSFEQIIVIQPSRGGSHLWAEGEGDPNMVTQEPHCTVERPPLACHKTYLSAAIWQPDHVPAGARSSAGAVWESWTVLP